MKSVSTDSPEKTRAMGELLGRLCKGGEVFLLDGNLGAGKTCFTQGLAVGLGIDIPVTSPTFVLHCQYQGRLELNHYDAYRLEGGAPLDGLGLEDFLGASHSVSVVEWPEFIQPALPDGCIKVNIEMISENERKFFFEEDSTLHFIETFINEWKG